TRDASIEGIEEKAGANGQRRLIKHQNTLGVRRIHRGRERQREKAAEHACQREQVGQDKEGLAQVHSCLRNELYVERRARAQIAALCLFLSAVALWLGRAEEREAPIVVGITAEPQLISDDAVGELEVVSRAVGV